MIRFEATSAPDHRVKCIQVPWAREGGRFTLLFEQAAVILAREMPVLAAARWRITAFDAGAQTKHREIYRMLNVPEQPMAPTRTWSES